MSELPDSPEKMGNSANFWVKACESLVGWWDGDLPRKKKNITLQ
jgi:hypothetical protein